MTEGSLRGNNRGGGLRGWQEGGLVERDQLGNPVLDSSTRHNNRDKKVPQATADYHLYSHTQTHAQEHAPSHSLANEGMHWGSGNAISHSVGVGINLAAESLEGSSLQPLEHSVRLFTFCNGLAVWGFTSVCQKVGTVG